MRRRRLGQHYLADPGVAMRMVEAAGIEPSDRVLEIGTGRGALTSLLARSGASLEGYEVDRENYEATLKAVAGTGAKIHLADAFETSPEVDVLVASLPYSESSRFVEWLCGLGFRRAVVMLQEDFVRKVTAPPGDRDYRGVSALVQVAFEVRVLERVTRAAFAPHPRVGSAVVSMVPRRTVSEEEASRIARLFSLRRRQVDSALAELGMRSAAGHGRRRVFSLTPEEVHRICAK
jgi:16S rRNA (adenine1518-N6/adenine1519-N6)-dimethyltransferase